MTGGRSYVNDIETYLSSGSTITMQGLNLDERRRATKLYKIYRILHFYCIKLPLIFIMIPIGFIFEYVITFPFIVLTALDRNPSKKRRGSR